MMECFKPRFSEVTCGVLCAEQDINDGHILLAVKDREKKILILTSVETYKDIVKLLPATRNWILLTKTASRSPVSVVARLYR